MALIQEGSRVSITLLPKRPLIKRPLSKRTFSVLADYIKQMADLIEKWQKGDESAFEAIFHQYHNLVRRTAIGIVNDGNLAEDVVQDVFVSAWRSRYTFDPKKGKLATWLYRITVNQCARYRRKKIMPSTSLEDVQARGFQLAAETDCSSGSPDPEAYAEYDRMMAAVRSLNGNHRPVIILRYLNDLPYSEIAKALDIPLGTVKSRLNEAIKILRKEFNGERTP